MAKKFSSGIEIDWFTVSYKTLYTWITVVVLALVAGGVFFYLNRTKTPDERARIALRACEGQMGKIDLEQLNPDQKQNFLAAKSTLEQARAAFENQEYDAAVQQAGVAEETFKRLVRESKSETKGYEATIVDLAGLVEIKRSKEVKYKEAKMDSRLFEGDFVRLGKSSSARVRYTNGVEAELGADSLTRIQRVFIGKSGRPKVEIDVKETVDGRVGVTTSSGSEATISTRITQVNLGVDAKSEVQFRNRGGKAEVTAERGPVEVSVPSKGVTRKVEPLTRLALAEGAVESVTKILPPPDLRQPVDGRIFLYKNPTQERTALEWDRVKGAGQYRFHIDRSPLFTRPLNAKDRTRETSIVLPGLRPGTYFWRVACIDKEGTQGNYSPSRRFKISDAGDFDPADQVPPKLENLAHRMFGTRVLLSGATDPGTLVMVDGKRVEVQPDGTFQAFVVVERKGANTYTITVQDPIGNETVEEYTVHYQR